MPRTLIADAKRQAGQQVTLQAWVQVSRHQGKIVFLVLRDISGTIQAVMFDKKLLDSLSELSVESVVEVTGEIKEAEQAPDGVEIAVSSLKVLSEAHPELAIPVHEKAGETGQEKRLDWRWIDLRKPRNQLIFKVWTALEEGAREYWTSQNYLQIHSPKLMGTASESGAEVFKVEYFDTEAYLAQSPQFYKQMAMAAGLERVFEVGPVFRAEPSFTTRHATEFTGYDAEISFIDGPEDVMAETEGVLVAMFAGVKAKHGEAIKTEFGQEVVVPQQPFPAWTMAEAKERLAKRGVKSDHSGDLSPEEERTLSEINQEENKHDFLFITDWPADKRAFYHMRHGDRRDITKGFDLLYRGVEVVTGAQREHRYDILVKQATDKKMDKRALDFYLNFFKFGCPPHGGYGMGPARIIMKLLDVENIREITFVHRGVKRLSP